MAAHRLVDDRHQTNQTERVNRAESDAGRTTVATRRIDDEFGQALTRHLTTSMGR